MKFELSAGQATAVRCDVLIVSLFQQQKVNTPLQAEDAAGVHRLIHEFARANPDCAKYGEVNAVSIVPAGQAKQILILGLGGKDSLTLDKLRAAAAIAIRAARKFNPNSVAAVIPKLEQFSGKRIVQSIVEGTKLGNYQFLYYKTEQKPASQIEKFLLVNDAGQDNAALKKALTTATIIAESVNFARDLVNHPSCYITPARLAHYAEEIAKTEGLEVEILDIPEMTDLKMSALLAVARGSAQPPKLITLKYIGDKDNAELFAYIGKGITFDSGGISLKPSADMGDMKGDMAGGAAVLAAMQGIARLKPKANILAVIPCAENMPSGCALKPGDVINSMGGYTIEIITTDAEGRLLLADAVTYARKLGATRLIDIATLTGACVVALGDVASGVITNDQDWCRRLFTAAEHCGEKLWQLPAYEEYKEQIKSDIADIKNSGGRKAGMVTAGLFIEKFAAGTPWAHIDIAGTSDITAIKGYNPKGATGVSVRTLIQLALEN
ncbi:leucyl aminopeptidase|uniref:Probable cytosol aminopeptidase n=1 Tax=Dendrosporobacter quercicolus TaxID=146817 RepID=A0A1G9LPE5_9FIRM|nr:leucyl aminopeptidase [Dendrosporobacter quercicolus]NSL46787.1 leucyl aminopeptidase [Dendrosporobacter quercicolus DSM 1736]SDL63882.1 leucyl aminopeptidase [Dendrosporobacter quercicolus]